MRQLLAKFDFNDLSSRPWRLTIILICLAIAFGSGRLILITILGLILLVLAIQKYIIHKQSYFGTILPVALIGLLIGIYYLIDYNRVINYREDHSPLDLALVGDGSYIGSAEGFRGPIKVQVEVQNYKISDIRILQHQEMITALEGIREQIIEKNRLDAELIPSTIHGTIQTTEGFRQAVINALWQGVDDKPEFSWLTRHLTSLFQYRVSMTTWNALAILFCIVLVFDYTLQPVLVKGTGQALNCYNCQTCVGVCPVKIVDGEPYPMTMILAARLGDYEKVNYLSKYCVACSRCAGKCPVGDSGPSIAAAANAALKLIRSREKKTKG
jgi:uncharacterized protein with FMN-binding domain